MLKCVNEKHSEKCRDKLEKACENSILTCCTLEYFSFLGMRSKLGKIIEYERGVVAKQLNHAKLKLPVYFEDIVEWDNIAEVHLALEHIEYRGKVSIIEYPKLGVAEIRLEDEIRDVYDYVYDLEYDLLIPPLTSYELLVLFFNRESVEKLGVKSISKFFNILNAVSRRGKHEDVFLTGAKRVAEEYPSWFLCSMVYPLRSYSLNQVELMGSYSIDSGWSKEYGVKILTEKRTFSDPCAFYSQILEATGFNPGEAMKIVCELHRKSGVLKNKILKLAYSTLLTRKILGLE